jgi:hypothetical protein
MRYLTVPIVLAFAMLAPARAADGLVAVKSPHDVKATIDRVEAAANPNLKKALEALAAEAIKP